MSKHYPNGSVGSAPNDLAARVQSAAFRTLRLGALTAAVTGVTILAYSQIPSGGTLVDAPEFANGKPAGHHATIQDYSGVFTLADKETRIYADGVTEHGSNPNLTFCMERGVLYAPNGPDELYDGRCIPRDKLTIPGGYQLQ